MNKNTASIKFFFLTICIPPFAHFAFSQDSLKFKIDSTWDFPVISFSASSLSTDYLITHSPAKDDITTCSRFAKLITSEPTIKNHSDYYALACALWELNRLTEAEKMFLKIVNCKESYYEDTYYHSSDITGDTTTNTYGYGRFTSNYKNYACRFLTKIYIEEKKFKDALKYLEYADKRYTITFNCGTGNMWYEEEIKGLYGLCYEGSGNYYRIINMFLPDYSNWRNGTLIRAIKKIYNRTEINNYLAKAESSIVCIVDTFKSSSFTTLNYGSENEKTIESKYISGQATMNLFGKQVSLPTPNLENGDVVTRERFAREFKESGFYKALTDEN
jgi:tetratricopeptide (TPR) repeat protein